jgi:hypothetical protein
MKVLLDEPDGEWSVSKPACQGISYFALVRDGQTARGLRGRAWGAGALTVIHLAVSAAARKE